MRYSEKHFGQFLDFFQDLSGVFDDLAVSEKTVQQNWVKTCNIHGSHLSATATGHDLIKKSLTETSNFKISTV